MKQRVKSKSNNDLFLPFVLVILFCFFGAATNGTLFYNSFFRSLSKLNEEPIATITFKYKTAQRKFLNRVVWDRLKQHSPVYNGDIIHTSTASEATIWFSDGNVMDLSENTMTQVFIENGKLTASLDSGFATVDSSLSKNGMALSVNDTQVKLDAGSSVQAGKSNAGDTAIQVADGSATLQNKDGKSVTLQKDASIQVSSTGQVAQTTLVVTSPLSISRVIYHTQGEATVPFGWRVANDIQNSVIITIAKQKNMSFDSIIQKISLDDTTSKNIKLPPGTYFWTVSLKDQTTGDTFTTQTGKLQIVQSLPPELVAPVKDYCYNYRNKLPAVRLIWTDSPLASSYHLEISRDTSFKNKDIDETSTLTSCIISTLQEGKYYWRVTPYYSVNKIGYATGSRVGEFLIEKKAVLIPPKLLTPQENNIIDIEQSPSSLFSWGVQNEAASYIVQIADNQDIKNPIIKQTTQDNFINIQVSKDLQQGTWYWAVASVDTQNNVSSLCAARSFTLMAGKPEQHIIQPTDGYKVATSLLPDMLFTWKRNLPQGAKSTLQIAQDDTFKKVVHTSVLAPVATSTKGINLKEGKYFWRLSSVTKDGIEFNTKAKSFEVLGPLAGATLQEPLDKLLVLEEKPDTLKWQKVAGADFYKVSIYDNGKVYLEETVFENELKTYLYTNKEFKDRTWYSWSVQAFSNASDTHSRRTGMLSRAKFFLHRVHPITFAAPVNNTKIKALDALLSPPVATWECADSLLYARFTLEKIEETKKTTKRKTIIKSPTDKEYKAGVRVASKKILLDTQEGLAPGVYEMSLSAMTLDEIDVSVKKPVRFRVLSAPPLKPPLNLKASPEVFDSSFVASQGKSSFLTLFWDAVQGANCYEISIENQKGKIITQEQVSQNQYTIDFNKMAPEAKTDFINGKYKFSVQALNKVQSKRTPQTAKVFQKSDIVYKDFYINIATPTTASPQGILNPYD